MLDQWIGGRVAIMIVIMIANRQNHGRHHDSIDVMATVVAMLYLNPASICARGPIK